MALDRDDIARLRLDAEKTMAIKAKEALSGHDWVIDNHCLSSSKLAQLAFYAEMGRRVIDAWVRDVPGGNMPPFDVRFTVHFEGRPRPKGERQEPVAYRWRCTEGDEPNQRWRVCEVLPNLDGMGRVEVQPLYLPTPPHGEEG
jgi:hypothetical protein